MLGKVAVVALKTIISREVVRVLRLWSQTLLPSVITSILYFVIFGHVLGSRFGSSNGFSYSQYIAPGLIMMAVINMAYANVSSSYFTSKFQRVIDELLVAPISVHVILWGYIGGGLIRGFMVGILVTAVAAVFANIAVVHIAFMILVLFLSSILFALAGFINGLCAKKFDDIMFVPTFVLTPLTYLGGVFYTLNSLPSVWSKISLLNPIFYLVNAFRFAMIGYSEVSLTATLVVISGFIISLYSIAAYMFHKRIGVRL